MGFQTTNSHPKQDGTASNPKPTELRPKLFKNLKGIEAIAKGGKLSNPIPDCGSRIAVVSLERTVGRSDRRAFVDLCAEEPVIELLLPVDAMGLRFLGEKLGCSNKERLFAE